MMADDIENDEDWLYGDPSETNDPPSLQELPEQPLKSNESDQPNEEAELTNGLDTGPLTEDTERNETATFDPEEDEQPFIEQENDEKTEDFDEEKLNDEETTGEDKEPPPPGQEDEEDDEESDDDVNVVINSIKSTATYASMNIKRSNLVTSSIQVDKSKQVGKYTIEDFDQVLTINGITATDFNLDSLEDKPWRKPGADITDYFNYGFNEDTWRAYCERQRRLRLSESGAGLPAQITTIARATVPLLNDNSKYAGNFLGTRKAGPPPARRMTGAIDVIGSITPVTATTPLKNDGTKVNAIQVMTADRREYSRKPPIPGFPDMSVPPPTAAGFDDFQPDYGFNPEPEPFYGGFEPTQDVQWGTNGPPPVMGHMWPPSEMKNLPPGPIMPPMHPGLDIMRPPASPPPPPPVHRRSRSRDREHRDHRARSERREKSHRRDRSRSRSRKHRSRTRSPGHRSQKKKKSSKRHEESD